LVEMVRGSDYLPQEGNTERFEVDGVAVKKEDMVGRAEILVGILNKAQASTLEYGIELVDVQIKRINYVERVRTSVYERMINERKKVAAQYRSEGEGEKAEILGKMERELKEISSKAYRKVLEVRGAADAEAASIYAQAYNQDKEFYAFLRTLASYKKSIQKNGKLVISTDSDYYRYLKQAK
ncbi:MAG: protease modulator HflC, partial [Desulfuromonadales bacterium]|nr:protease modulator HflC [Desulfuromonadales bacterium]